MADTELVPEGEPEVIVAPEEGEPEVQTAPDPLEEVASEMGWVPKDKFKGDEAAWKPARDYIRAGKDIQSSTARQLKEFKETLDNVSRTSATIAQQAVEEERAKWQAKFATAVEEGDPNAALEASNRLQTVNAKLAPPPPTAAVEFAKANPWFNDDPLATRLALDVAEQYARAGKSAEDQLSAAKREVERQYPHLAPQSAVQGKPQASVSQPTTRVASPPAKRGFHDLPPAAQTIAKDMEERLGIPTATYVTNYFAAEGKAR